MLFVQRPVAHSFTVNFQRVGNGLTFEDVVGPSLLGFNDAVNASEHLLDLVCVATQLFLLVVLLVELDVRRVRRREDDELRPPGHEASLDRHVVDFVMV